MVLTEQAEGAGSRPGAALRRDGTHMTPLAAAGLGVMAAAQLAYPLAAGQRALLSTVTVVAAATAAVVLGAGSWGWPRTAAALAGAAVLTLAVEALGVRTGVPFGDDVYGPALRPQLLGVPVIVPLAWFALGLPAWVVAGRVAGGLGGRIAVGAAALTAWDLFLDPQMTAEGFWRWRGGGPYRDVPLGNFAGWLAVAALLMGLFAAVGLRRPGGAALLGLYVWTWALEALGFLLFFGAPLVALVGGLGMGVPAVLALRAEIVGADG